MNCVNDLKEKILGDLQQMKEPYITTYAKKYRVMKERHFKQSVFFYAVKQQIISFLLDCSITY